MSTISLKDRFLAVLPYILPLVYAFFFGQFFLAKVPILLIIYLPLLPLISLYAKPFVGFIIFFALYAGVVRNPQINYFIRFNTLQAILIDIALTLLSLVLQLFAGLGGLVYETLSNVVFLATFVTCIYAMVQTGLGRDAEIPFISEAVRPQL